MSAIDPVLVTGGTGFFGNAVVEHLLQRGERVRVIGRRARVLAAAEYSWPKVLERLGGLYARVRSSRGGRETGSVIGALAAGL